MMEWTVPWWTWALQFVAWCVMVGMWWWMRTLWLRERARPDRVDKAVDHYIYHGYGVTYDKCELCRHGL